MQEQLQCSTPTHYHPERITEFLALTLCHDDVSEDTRIDSETFKRLEAEGSLSAVCDAALGEYADWLHKNLQANLIVKSEYDAGLDRIQSIVRFLGTDTEKHDRRGGRPPKIEYIREAFGSIVVKKNAETIEKTTKPNIYKTALENNDNNPTTIEDQLEFVAEYSDIESIIRKLYQSDDILDVHAKGLILYFKLQVVPATANTKRVYDYTANDLRNRVYAFKGSLETRLNSIVEPVKDGVRQIEYLLDNQGTTLENIVDMYVRRKGMPEADARQLVNGRTGAALTYLYSLE